MPLNPKEMRLKDETMIGLETHASRMNIQLLKATDFNEKLLEKAAQKMLMYRKCAVTLETRRKSVKSWRLCGKTRPKPKRSLQWLLRRTRTCTNLRRCLKDETEDEALII